MQLLLNDEQLLLVLIRLLLSVGEIELDLGLFVLYVLFELLELLIGLLELVVAGQFDAAGANEKRGDRLETDQPRGLRVYSKAAYFR